MYTDPKNDWAVGDAVSNGDLNSRSESVSHIYEELDVGFRAVRCNDTSLSSALQIPSGFFIDFGIHPVTLAVGQSLWLRRIRWVLPVGAAVMVSVYSLASGAPLIYRIITDLQPYTDVIRYSSSSPASNGTFGDVEYDREMYHSASGGSVVVHSSMYALSSEVNFLPYNSFHAQVSVFKK
jgi:hypothetical protein